MAYETLFQKIESSNHQLQCPDSPYYRGHVVFTRHFLNVLQNVTLTSTCLSVFVFRVYTHWALLEIDV